MIVLDVSKFNFVVVLKDSIMCYTNSVSDGCGSVCKIYPICAKRDRSDRHQDGYCRNASATFSSKPFLSRLSFATTHE
jgi:hypothetical protein